MAIRGVPLLYGLGVGLSYTLVTFALYGAFRGGAPISIVSPAVRFGGLIVAAAAGLLMWREPLTPRYLAGFGMVIVGLALLLKR
jgi:drug/metabolite transporter (DMT)-like permease